MRVGLLLVGEPVPADLRPADLTEMLSVMQGLLGLGGLFQSTPTGLPAGDLQDAFVSIAGGMFQSTPTGFPAGDANRPRHAVA